MPVFPRHHHLRRHAPPARFNVFPMGGMIFFFALFNGIVSYFTPLAFDRAGISGTLAGVIYAFSSVAGAGFDIILERLVRNLHWKRMFLWMFAFAAFFPVLLAEAKTIPLFLFAMALWGVYFDFYTYGRFDYTGRLPNALHASAWGAITSAQAGGLILAPFIFGVVVHETENMAVTYSLIFLACSALIYCFILATRGRAVEFNEPLLKRHRKPTIRHAWMRTARILFPVLLLTIGINVIDSFFWLLGPLISQSIAGGSIPNGAMVSAYLLPSLLSGSMVASLTRRYHKKRTAYATFGFGCLLLCFFPLALSLHPFAALVLVAVSSLGFSLAWPALNGAFADYIQESPEWEKEIESTEDLSSNVGYIIGPLLAGIASDLVGRAGAFTVIGLLGMLLALFLFAKTPRRISLEQKNVV